MVFLENTKRKVTLYSAGFLISAATVINLFAGNLRFKGFLLSLKEVLNEYWLLLLVSVITVLLFFIEQHQSKK